MLIQEFASKLPEGFPIKGALTKTLTKREGQVLLVMCDDITHEEVAQRLGISRKTISTHLTRIYAKIGVHSHAGAIMWALRNGLLSAPLVDNPFD